MIVAERDQFQADLQHARATEAGKHATTSFLEARLTDTQAALQKGRIEADALETKLRGKERQSELDQQHLFQARHEAENVKI